MFLPGTGQNYTFILKHTHLPELSKLGSFLATAISLEPIWSQHFLSAKFLFPGIILILDSSQDSLHYA
jgi:hypothetical protein